MQAVDQVYPRLEILGVMLELEEAQNLGVQTFATELYWDGVDGVHVFHGNDAGFGYVAEERDFLFQV
jgi:hypothetical protein